MSRYGEIPIDSIVFKHSGFNVLGSRYQRITSNIDFSDISPRYIIRCLDTEVCLKENSFYYSGLYEPKKEGLGKTSKEQ